MNVAKIRTPALRAAFFWLLIAGVLPADGQEYRTSMNTLKCRPLAMGGAFMAERDGLAALNYNPAGLVLDDRDTDFQWRISLNPAGPLLAASNSDRVEGPYLPLLWTVHGAMVRWHRITAGLLAGEESPRILSESPRDGLLDGNGFDRGHHSVLGVSLELAPRVRFGAAGEMIVRGSDLSSSRFGYRYGLTVEARGNLTMGLCYFAWPKGRAVERMPLDRLPDETLNLGLVWQPGRFLTAAFDFRNVSDEAKGAWLEPHAGIELQPVSGLFLRGGWTRSEDGGRTRWSGGLGVEDWLSFFGGPRERTLRFGTDLSWVSEQAPVSTVHWIFLVFRVDVGGHRWFF